MEKGIEASIENRNFRARAKLAEVKLKATQICAQVVSEVWEIHLKFLRNVEKIVEKFDEDKVDKELKKFFIELGTVGKGICGGIAGKGRDGLGLVLKRVEKDVGFGVMMDSGFYVDDGKVGINCFCVTGDDRFIVVCIGDLVSWDYLAS